MPLLSLRGLSHRAGPSFLHPHLRIKCILCFQSLCVRCSYYTFLIHHMTLSLLTEQACTDDLELEMLAGQRILAFSPPRGSTVKSSNWKAGFLESNQPGFLAAFWGVRLGQVVLSLSDSDSSSVKWGSSWRFDEELWVTCLSTEVIKAVIFIFICLYY